tara:strand:+ start:789 stop:1529 length:741 start_codon:yes stop_codon:yes gene_type:complete
MNTCIRASHSTLTATQSFWATRLNAFVNNKKSTTSLLSREQILNKLKISLEKNTCSHPPFKHLNNSAKSHVLNLIDAEFTSNSTSKPTDSLKKLFSNDHFIAPYEGRIAVYSVQHLWELTKDLPVEQLPLTILDPILDQPCDMGEGAKEPYRVFIDYIRSPNTAKHPQLSDKLLQGHLEKIEKCDLSYPIIVLKTKTDLRILDGNHRFSLAHKKGMTAIPAVVLDAPPKPDALFSSIAEFKAAKRR